MAMQSDRHGFLVGSPVASDDSGDLLGSIKGDTGKILRALMKAGAVKSSGRSVEPVRRASLPARDEASGRFVTSARPEPSRPQSSTGMSRAEKITVANSERTARASERTAKAQEKQLESVAASRVEDEQAAQRDQARAKNGRFTGSGEPKDKTKPKGGFRFMDWIRGKRGGKGGGDGGVGGIADAASHGVDNVLNAGERVDPIIEALKEAKSGATSALSVVSPVGRTLMGALKMAMPGEAGKQRRGALGARMQAIPGYRAIAKTLSFGHKAAGYGGAMARKAGGGALRLGGRALSAAGGVAAEAGSGIMSLLARYALPILAPIAAGILGFFTGTKLYSLIEEPWGKVCDWFIALDIKKEIGDAWGKVTTGISDSWDGVVNSARDVFGRFANWVDNLPGMKTAKNAVNTVTDAASSAWDTTKGTLAKGWDATKGFLVSAAQKTGVDPGLLAKITGQESGFDPNARPIQNGRLMSSAHGLGQMLDGTWVDQVRKNGEQFGVAGASKMTKEQALALRNDPQLQADLLGSLTAENVKMGRSLGGKDDAANVYALHNLGAGDGAKFLKAYSANPNASVSDVLSDQVIKNNPSLYKDGRISIGDAYGNMGRAMDRGNGFAAQAQALAATVMTPALPTIGTPALSMMRAPPGIGPVNIPRMSEDAMPTRLTGSFAEASSPSAPVQMPSQDVPDRTIAHIASGGIGGSLVRR